MNNTRTACAVFSATDRVLFQLQKTAPSSTVLLAKTRITFCEEDIFDIVETIIFNRGRFVASAVPQPLCSQCVLRYQARSLAST